MPSPNLSGKVYLVGAGPGDPALITVRGAEILRQADVVLADGLVSPLFRSLADPTAEWISVGKHGGPRLWKQSEIDDQLVVHAKLGRKVVRLKGGDTGVFARSAEELQRLAAEEIPFEVVPGITAALAAAAYTGVPLTHRDWASAVALVTGQLQASDGGSEIEESFAWDRLAQFPGTLVIYMGVTTAPVWSQKLMDGGLPSSTPVAIVRRCSWPDQLVLRCRLDEVAVHLNARSKLRPPVLAIVGDVAALGEAYDWFSAKPLFGCTVVVTRPEHQNDTLAEQLRQLGAIALRQSALRIEPPDDLDSLDTVHRQLSRFQWIVFTSSHGVHHFLESLHRQGLDGRALASIRIAGVGPSVAEALSRWHLRCDMLPEGEPGNWNAQGLAVQLLNAMSKSSSPSSCLVVRADRGKTTVEDTLRQAGHDVESIIAYRSVDTQDLTPEVAAALDENTIDYVLVTSASGARNLVRLMGQGLARTICLAISEDVAKVLREADIDQVQVSQQSHLQSMVDLLLHLESTKRS